MRKLCAILLCLALLAGLGACGTVTQHDPPEPPDIPAVEDKLCQEITVMSFNVLTQKTGEHGVAKRKNGVLQTILRESPDSVGLQEAHGQWRSFLRRELKENYAMACAKGRYAGIGEGVPILYRKDKYELVEEDVFWLSEHPRIPSRGWDAPLRPRVAGYAVLKDKETGFIYVHFNAHFDNRGEIARINSARMIADRINEMGLPSVFTGDLNTFSFPEDLLLQYLAAGGLQNLREVSPAADTGSTHLDYGDGALVLDHIYANHYLRLPGTAQFRVIRDEYDGQYPSDHFAVTATFTLAN